MESNEEKDLLMLSMLGLGSVILSSYSFLLLSFLTRWKRQNSFLMAAFSKKSYSSEKLNIRRSRRLRRKPRRYWYDQGRTDDWWVKLLSGKLNQDCWKKNFRMHKDAFMNLVTELEPYIAPHPETPNYRAVDSQKKVAITLYYLKDTGSLNQTANLFGIDICTSSKIIFEVCRAIKALGPKYIKHPKTDKEMEEKIAKFEVRFGMPCAFGCIDGTHFPIQRPSENAQDFYNYKQFYSLSAQAVCDYRGIFMDVDCRWPGSVHHAKVLFNSKINKSLMNKTLPVKSKTLIPGLDPVPNYIIGDPAYPLTSYCMKEYETCTNNEQVIFNNLLRSGRNQIECAFGRLKARWSILTRKINLKLEAVPIVVYACFALHNYCELSNCPLDENDVTEQIKLNRCGPIVQL